LFAEVTRILVETCDRIGVEVPAKFRTLQSLDGNGPGIEVGEHRARQNIHPVDSLTAAAILFDIALSAIVEETGPTLSADVVARGLNMSIMQNVIPAAVAYVNVLLERLAVAHSEERLGIARDLHDRVAHSIAVGIQRIGPSGVNPRTKWAPPEERINAALGPLTEALDETRMIALELRHFVGDKLLSGALADYALDIKSSRPQITVTDDGEPFRLPMGTQEEAFIIVREAINNARQHANADNIYVHSIWWPKSVTVAVSDDGHGFRRADVRPGALGLVAAQERAELIGAELSIQPGITEGTTVTLTIPIPTTRSAI
jgi:signal transduction histidine kinase